MGIFIAAMLVTVVAFAVMVRVLLWRRTWPERRLFLIIAAFTLPLSALAFHALRLPLDHWLSGRLAGSPGLLTALRLCYAPLTEEPAKLLVFCVPWVWRQVDHGNLMRAALAVGLGFGVGEAWMLAHLLSANPDIVGQPWYAFQGFIFERAMTFFIHAGMTAIALLGLVRRHAGMGLAMIGMAMLCHFLVNLPIYLVGLDSAGFSKGAKSFLLAIWVQACAVTAIVWLARLGGWRMLMVRCPECAITYMPSLMFGVNLGSRRYERCPACRRWHLISHDDRIINKVAP